MAEEATRTEQRRVGVPDRTKRRRVTDVMIAACGVLFLAGLWLAVTALMARSELNLVRAEAHTLGVQLSAGQWSPARATAADLAAHAHSANQLTSGPVWALAAVLPFAGEPLKTIRGVTAAADLLGRDALPQLVGASRHLNPHTLRRADGSIDLSRVAAIGPAVASASAVVAQATNDISGLPRHTWLGSIDAAYADALGQVTVLDNALTSANLAVRIVPTMLGQDGPKRYFLAFQNESEARGTGGLPGAFAIVEANHGKLRFTHMESDTALDGVSANVGFGPGYNQLYGGASTTTLYVNGNLSPNFPYAAQIWASMWRNHSGEKVDGVLAVDPTVLSYLLAVTGPATLPDGSQVSAANAVALTQSIIYAKFSGLGSAATDQRKVYLLDVAAAASTKILDARGDLLALLRAAGKAAGERRILVWSADPAVQADLAKTVVAGIIPITRASYVGLSIVNDAGNKLDYYLDRSVSWERTGCGPARPTTVTITLTNNAPASGLPQYVTLRSDSHPYVSRPGDNRLEVSYLATQGALMEGVTLQGRPATASIGTESGHPVYTIDVELPRGTSRTIVLHLSEPAAVGQPIVLRQPLVRPLNVRLVDAVCN